MDFFNTNNEKRNGMTVGFAFALFCIAILLIAVSALLIVLIDESTSNSTGDLTLKRPTPVMTGVNVIVTLDSYKVDYGNDGGTIYYEVYWDDDNTGEFEEGVKCSAWDRHYNSQSNIEQNIGKYCRINTDDKSHQASLTACLFDDDDNKYDIYSEDSDYGSCLISRNLDIEPKFYSWKAQCSDTTSGSYTETNRAISWSGLEDNDDNQYNGVVNFSIDLEYEFDCVVNE